jgi:hypothetical protein
MFKYPVLTPPPIVGYGVAACVGEKEGPVGSEVGEAVNDPVLHIEFMYMPF